MTETVATTVAEKSTTAPAAPAPTGTPAPAPAADLENDLLALADDDIDVGDDEAPEAEEAEANAGEDEAPDLTDYVYEPPAGQELNPGAQSNIDAFAAFSAKSGLEPEQFSQSIDFFNGLVEQQKAKMAEADKAAAEAMQTNLGETWGDQYDSNFAVARDGAKALPKSLRQAFKTARTADGQLVSLMPEFAQLLHQLAGQPAIAGTKPFDMEAADARILEITRLRDKDFGEYIQGKYDVELAKLTERKAAHTPTAKPVPLNADDKREAAILKVLRNNYNKYYADGLDRELAEIRARRGAN